MPKRPYRFAFFALLLVVTIAASAITAGGQQPQPESYIPQQVIVKLTPTTPVADALAVRSSLNATVKRRFPSIGAELWEIKGLTVNQAVDRFRGDKRLEYIEPNFRVHALDLFPNDPRFDELWGMHNTGQTGGTPDADIDAPEAWSIGTGGTVLVGVIDTGCDYNHVDLAANIFTNTNETPGNGIDDDGNGYIDDVRGWDFVNNDNNPMDDHGHGTHVSGTIAAIGNNGVGVVGVSWSARVMPLKFLDAGGFGSTSDAILAVEYATAMGARLTSNSWGGGGFSQALMDAIEAAGNAGILFVAAAGNASSNNDIFENFPSNYPLDNIIAVASTDHRDLLSGFSNFGLTTVDLGAPGTDILSTFPGNSYGVISGTSMATPHVSGAVSLVWAAAPTLTAMEVKNAIMGSVDVIPALVGRTVTGGRLNVHTLMAGLDDVAPDPVNDLAVQSTGSSHALLGWTASGDDGSIGTASAYDVRFSTSPIDSSNFDAAQQAGGEPAPQPVGSSESFEVGGLDFNTTYYFALVVIDEQGNRSGISNVPNGTTLGAPTLEYAPTSFSASLLTGGSDTQTLTISNTGEGTLDFRFDSAALQTGVVGGVAAALLPSWLTASPASGRVNAGESMEVDLTFNATGLFGGDYHETVTFATNDPAQEAAPLDVSLHVDNAADVSATPTSLDFGQRYTGLCGPLAIQVTNIGTLPLDVSGLSIDNSEFSVDPSGFTLGLGESRVIQVDFCPVTVGALAGTLSIASNDPDHPTLTISLAGEGVAPPVIAVDPTSLSADLFTGGVDVQALTISNNGGSDLNFDISIEDLGSSAARLGSVQSAPDRMRDVTPGGAQSKRTGVMYAAGHKGTGRPATAGAPKITAATSLSILLVHSAEVSEIQGLLLGFPDVAIVDSYDAGSSTPDLPTLSAYDAVILIANSSFSDPTALGDVLADYVDAGGGVTMTLASFIDGFDVAGRFFDEGYYPFTLGSGPLGGGNLNTFDASHPIMAGVSSAFGDLLGATTLAPGAEWVADWDIGQPFIATQGDHVVGANVFVADGGFFSGDVALILHNAALWSAGAAWLSTDPTEGVIPAGASLDVAVTFDATGLNGGDYASNIRIANNDPFNPEVVVPANMHVTGAPDIELSATALAYGQVFIGGVSNKVLEISNPGTDVLHIASIVTNHPDYDVDVADATLAPGASQNVVVSFAPTSTGIANGTLTVTSDDPDEAVLAVSLEGEGLLPPIIGVAPSSFEDSLFTGETSSHTMTISNTGVSNLDFEISTEETEPGIASVRQKISIPRSNGDFPRGTQAASARLAPSSGHGARTSGDPMPQASVGSAFASEAANLQMAQFHLNNPETLNFVGSTPTFIWAGDFGGDDAFVYAVDDVNQFMQIDTTTGTQTVLGTIVPFGSEIWTGMAFDPTDGTMYATGTDIFSSSLYVIDVAAATSTRIGSIGFPGVIACAVSSDGVLYAHDLVTDELLSIDKTTGAGTAIGSLGFDANFGQGMGFDKDTGQLYLAAFNNFTFQAELRIADVTTGATALVGVLGSDVPGGTNQLGFLAIPGLGGVRWLIADPSEGVVPPGTSMDVEVTFDATGLFGGDYYADLVIANNDPLNSEVRVPAHLHVTGAPDIAVTETSLDYGPVFIGGVSQKTVHIKNAGTDVLTVSSIATDHGDYTVDVASVVLAPATSQDVVVSYAPTSVGPSSGSLTILSDDPDEAVIIVSLSGEGVEPPIIGVTPSSFHEDLFTGGTATHTMTISNTGASNLEFSIALEDMTTTAAASRAQLLRGRPWLDRTLHGGGAVGTGADAPNSRAPHRPMTVTPPTRSMAAGDPTILVIQDSAPWGLDMPSFIFDNFGIVCTVIGGSQIASTTFDDFDLVVTCGDQSFSYYSALSSNVEKFEDYVAGGGVVQYQCATQGDEVDLVGGVHVQFGPLETFNDVVDPSHPIVAGLPLVLEGNSANHTVLMNLPGSATVITETSDSGDPTTVEYDFGSGSVIATGMTWEFLYNFGFDAGAMLGNAVAYSLSIAGVKWLEVEPGEGVVAPGGSMDLTVKFDAAGLYGGDYAADIRVANNDPLTPEVIVPATLHVTGAPDIAVEDTLLAYGQVFVGGVSNKTVVIKNEGTDVLTGSLVSSHTDYSIDVNAFTLPPEASQNVVVSFAPTSIAPITGTLTITSDDPDEGTIVIFMEGEGLEAPIISVAPPSMSADLLTGQTDTQLLTISNSGGNNLEFEIRTEETGPGVASVRQKISIPRSNGEFSRGTHAASARLAPASGHGTRTSGEPMPQASVGSAFASEAANLQAAQFHLNNPETLNFVGSTPTFIWAGDFGGDDAFVYAVDDFNQFMQIDTTTGTQTVLGNIVPFGSEIWTGMAFDPTTETMYATGTDIFSSSLYVIDVAAVTSTRIGAIGSPGVIACAVDTDGVLYAHDVVTDELLSIDKTTGAGTVIGSLGFDANFGQGMGFDKDTGQLYLAAFNNFTFQAELRIADVTTGATALVGVLGSDVPGGTNQLGFLAIPGLGGVRWLIADPSEGVVPPGTSMDVEVTFDATGLFGGDYYADLVIENNDPLNSEVRVPTHLHVTGAPDIAVTETSLDYGQVFLGVVSPRTVHIKNAGTDVLTVSSIASDHGDYTVDVASVVLAPATSQDVVVSYAPTSVGPSSGSLTILSDDPDEAVTVVSLSGEGVEPPVIAVTPTSISETANSGDVLVRQLTIDNSAGGSNLNWVATTQFAGDAASVIEASPAFGTGAIVDTKKDTKAHALAARPDASAMYRAVPREPSPASIVASGTSLEDVLENLNANFGSVTSLIPSRFDFFEGDFGNNIIDGGNDMYDGGNFLGTNLGSAIFYSDNAIVSDGTFGPGGRYFTRKYPGLFVMAADMTDVEYFETFGNLGADGGGNVDGAVLDAEVAGIDFRGFVKRVYNAFDPSVNHLILVEENPGASHEFATSTDDDYHRVFNLAGTHRIYYLLYASEFGGYIDNPTTLAIMEAFLNALGLAPDWLSIAPISGTVPAGTSALVDVTLDATELASGDFDALISITSNDPVTPEVIVPTHLHVIGVPDITVSSTLLNFGQVFIGGTGNVNLGVSNDGTDLLEVSSIVFNAAQFTSDLSNFSVAAAASQNVVASFSPTATGYAYGTLTIASNDPDEASVVVTVVGEGIEPPVIAVTPESIVESLMFNTSTTRLLNIANTGANPLTFSVAIEPGDAVAVAAAEADGAVAVSGKNARVSQSGGGPDYYGYRWRDSNEPDGPTFAWIDASSGTNVSVSENGFVLGLPLAFTFHYYGYTYTTVGVGADGWLSFNGSGNGYPNAVPQLDNFAGAIAPCGRDLSPAGANYIRYLTVGSAPNRRFVVEYNGIPDQGGGDPKTFEVIFTEGTNSIRFQYLVAGNTAESFGIESPDESAGMGDGGVGDMYIDPALVENDYAIEFIGRPTWLDATPLGGSVPAGGNVDLTVSLNANGLEDGEYTARLVILNDDPAHPVVTVPVILTVVGHTTAILISDFAATAIEGGIELRWAVTADEEISGFNVYRASAGGGKEDLLTSAPISAQERHYLDEKVAGGRSYSYRIAAVRPDLSELFSQPATAQAKAFALVLEQNTPNPFNPTTRISYTLPRSDRVVLDIFDVAGRRVTTLVDEVVGEGRHETVWEGTDRNGTRVSSGVYFYRLTWGKNSMTKKMLMVK